MTKKSTNLKVYLVLTIIITLVSLAQPASAEGEQSGKGKVVGFFKNIFFWPLNIAKRGTEGVVNTGHEAAKGVAGTGRALSGVVTGDIQQLDDLAIEPVKGTARTGVKAVEETVKTPIEGTQETWSGD